jgi:hypothetical protein
MPKIFYLDGGTQCALAMRAVITLDDLESLLASESATHAGLAFLEASIRSH